VTILLPEGRQDEESGILNRMRQGQTIENYETLRRRKDGSLFDVSLTVSPVKDANGNVIGASKVARDITDKVRAKEKLEKTVAERTASLREAVAQMEEFSYTVSHDLRAPLRGMQVYAEALLQDFASALPAEASRYLSRIAANATRLDKMISEVLTFSRIARTQLGLTPVNTDKLVRQIVEQYPGLQAPGVAVEVKALHDVLGHEPSLTQALSNLLTNAVKFVAPNVKPRVCVWSEKEMGRVRIWVSDNGIGIEPKYHHRLFNMFERIHPDQKYDGTGVGLAIVRKAVERMGGTTGLESDGVNGSRFWIELSAINHDRQT
jgi:signal transduction histidine kinase